MIRRLLRTPRILLTAAGSFVTQSLHPQNPEDAKRREHFFGWLSPEMEPHWQRLENPQHPDYGSYAHSAKNVLSEWCALDPQRAGKLFSFLLVSPAALCAITFLSNILS